MSEIEPYYMIQCWGGAKGTGWVLLEDGTLMGTMVGPVSYDNPQYLSYILSSLDNGKTWRKILVPQTEDQARDNDECDLIRLTSGPDPAGGKKSGPGRSTYRWRGPTTTVRPGETLPSNPDAGISPPSAGAEGREGAVHLRSPFSSFGIRACMSSDGGETWDAGNEIVIEDNGRRHTSCQAVWDIPCPRSFPTVRSSLFTTTPSQQRSRENTLPRVEARAGH